MAPANRFLRLKGEYEYSDGDPYTDFELLVDAPEVPATRVRATPAHAVRGDVLRERYDDEVTPFELRRNGKRIGDPEWWQVRHLFEGLDRNGEKKAAAGRPGLLEPGFISTKADKTRREAHIFTRAAEVGTIKVEKGGGFLYWPGTHGADRWSEWWIYPVAADGALPVQLDTRAARACVEQDRIERDPKYDRPRRLASAMIQRTAFLEAAVMDLRAGDLIVWTEDRPEKLGGMVAPLTLDHYEALRSLEDDGKDPVTDLAPLKWWDGVRRFLRDRKRWGRRLTVWQPRLWRVRFPEAEHVSRTITAASDEAAIFELLCQVGGRMPVGA